MPDTPIIILGTVLFKAKDSQAVMLLRRVFSDKRMLKLQIVMCKTNTCHRTEGKNTCTAPFYIHPVYSTLLN